MLMTGSCYAVAMNVCLRVDVINDNALQYSLSLSPRIFPSLSVCVSALKLWVSVVTGVTHHGTACLPANTTTTTVTPPPPPPPSFVRRLSVSASESASP